MEIEKLDSNQLKAGQCILVNKREIREKKTYEIGIVIPATKGPKDKLSILILTDADFENPQKLECDPELLPFFPSGIDDPDNEIEKHEYPLFGISPDKVVKLLSEHKNMLLKTSKMEAEIKQFEYFEKFVLDIITSA